MLVHTDQIVKIDHSLIQHGYHNNRIYLMQWSNEDFPDIIKKLSEMAYAYQYTKIFVKVPLWTIETFLTNGYRKEAEIPNFYNGKTTACFLAHYLNNTRSKTLHSNVISDVLRTALASKQIHESPLLPQIYQFCVLQAQDTIEMSSLYQRVFTSYPFPIFDPIYLQQTMKENLIYYGIRKNGILIAIASCEMDLKYLNVEMTDFATAPEFQGQGLASYLLCQMEHAMIEQRILTAYSIARAISYGMNITFAKHAYSYAGCLIQNTNIAGSNESMNVWYKDLSQ